MTMGSMVIAGVVLVLAVLGLTLRAAPGLQVKVPGWVTGLVLGLLLGTALGFGVMYWQGWRTEIPRSPNNPMGGGAAGGPDASGKATPGGGMGMGGGGMGGGMGGGGMGGGGMGGGGMGGGGAGAGNSKAALLALVQKVGRVTAGLSLELSPQQAEQLFSALDELAQAEELSDDEARTVLDRMQGVLTDEQKNVLDFIAVPRRRDSGGAPGPQTSPRSGNPFVPEGDAKTALHELRGRLNARQRINHEPAKPSKAE